MKTKWENKISLFLVIDVSHLTTNFLPMILNKAQKVEIGDGICIVQSFEPKPLYSAMKDIGFEYMTEKSLRMNTEFISVEL